MVKTAGHHPRQWHIALDLAPFLYKDHTPLKQSDRYCQEKKSICLEEHWWEAIGENLWCHRMTLVQQGMLVGQRCPEPLSTDRQVLPGAHQAFEWLILLELIWIQPGTSQKPDGTTSNCTLMYPPHPACWNQGLSWKKAIFYVTEQAKKHKCVRFKQVFPQQQLISSATRLGALHWVCSGTMPLLTEGLPSTLALRTGVRWLHGQRTSVHAQIFPSL